VKKAATPSFILALSLKVQPYQRDILNMRLELARNIYNACITELERRYALVQQSKAYQKTMKQIRASYRQEQKQNHLNKIHGTKKTVSLEKLRKPLYKALSQHYRTYGLSEFDLHSFVAPMVQHVSCHIDSFTGQKIASHAWNAMASVLFGKGQRLHYKKYGQMNSLEGKSNRSGIRYRDGILHWLGLSIPVIVSRHDAYVQEALLTHRVKYCRIVRKVIRGDYRFFVQLVMEGYPPQKREKDSGMFKRQTQNAPVGLDIGTQTLAVSAQESVRLLELAPSVQQHEKELRRIGRKLDRQRRANNPHKYNPDGTIKKGHREPWIQSKNYLKTLFQLKELKRKQAALRKQDHEILANAIIKLGNEIKVETMRYDALAKRTKDTKVSEKTGRFHSKKRFGKSIANKAPALFLSILTRKLGYFGKPLFKIVTQKVKASQYNHIDKTYTPKTLDERWTLLPYQGQSLPIQRDLYSAFLIQHVTPATLDTIEVSQCEKHFDRFVALHQVEIERLRLDSRKKLASMGM
jgi:hypothetical protein